MYTEVTREHRWHKFGALLAFLFAVAILPTTSYILNSGTRRESGQVAGVSTEASVTNPLAECEAAKKEQLASLEDATQKGRAYLLGEYEKAVQPYEAAKEVLTGTEKVKASERSALDRLIATEYQAYQEKVNHLNSQYESEFQKISAVICQ